jgi:hypothetical protein
VMAELLLSTFALLR